MHQEKKDQTHSEQYGNVLMEWSFPEFETYTRGTGWYIGAGLLILFLLIYAVWTLNFLFAVMVLLGAVIIFFHTVRQPLNVPFTLTDHGIRIGRQLYSYREIKQFWILYHPPEVKTLYFVFKSFFRPRLSIPLTNRNPLKVREVLLQYLPEDFDRESEPASETFGRWLKL